MAGDIPDTFCSDSWRGWGAGEGETSPGNTPPPLQLGVECLKSASEPRIYWGKWTFDGGLAGSRKSLAGTPALHPSTCGACWRPRFWCLGAWQKHTSRSTEIHTL